MCTCIRLFTPLLYLELLGVIVQVSSFTLRFWRWKVDKFSTGVVLDSFQSLGYMSWTTGILSMLPFFALFTVSCSKYVCNDFSHLLILLKFSFWNRSAWQTICEKRRLNTFLSGLICSFFLFGTGLDGVLHIATQHQWVAERFFFSFFHFEIASDIAGAYVARVLPPVPCIVTPYISLSTLPTCTAPSRKARVEIRTTY